MANARRYLVAETLTDAVKYGRSTMNFLWAKANARELSTQVDKPVLVVQVVRKINALTAEAFYLTVAKYVDGIEVSLSTGEPLQRYR